MRPCFPEIPRLYPGPDRVPVRCLPHMAMTSFESGAIPLRYARAVFIFTYAYLTLKKFFGIILKKTFFKTALVSFSVSTPVRTSERGIRSSSSFLFFFLCSHRCSFVFTKADFYQPSYPEVSSHEYLLTKNFSKLFEPHFDFFKNF